MDRSFITCVCVRYIASDNNKTDVVPYCAISVVAAYTFVTMEDPQIVRQFMPPYMQALNTLLIDFLNKYRIPKPKVERLVTGITLFDLCDRYVKHVEYIDSYLTDEVAKQEFAPLRAAMLDIRGADASGDELTHTCERRWFYIHTATDEIFAQRIYAVGGGLYRKPVYDGEYHHFSNGCWKYSCMMSYGKQQGKIAKLSYSSDSEKTDC